MSGVQTLTPCGFLCGSTTSFSRKLSNPCNWHGVEYLFVEWMNGMDGWLDEQMLILSIISHLHQLMTWSSGISLSMLGWEPWLEVELLWGEAVSPWETLGWLVCLPVAWPLCCPFWEQTWCYRAALPSVCSKEVACSHESLLVIYLWRKLEFQGNLIEETFRGKRRNHMWHHMPGPGSPCPCPDPNHQPKSETGYPTPFSPLFVPCWPCFSRETVLIYNGWLGFFFTPKTKNLIHASNVESPKTHVTYETLRGQAHLASSYPRTWKPSFPILKLHLPFELSIESLSTREPLRVTWVLTDHSL